MFCMFKYDKSIDINELQKENIPFISSTLIVLKFDKSIETKEEHFENKLFIVITFSVLKLEKSIDFNYTQL